MHTEPPAIADPQTRQTLRTILEQSGLGSPDVLSGLGIQSIGLLGKVRWEAVAWDRMPPLQSVFVRWFLKGNGVSRDEAERVVDPAALRALETCGLLRSLTTDSEQKDPRILYSPLLLYAVHGLWVVSDRVSDLHGIPLEMGADAVFPALYPGTLRFLRLIPELRGDGLDICGGTGIGAMQMSRGAGAKNCVTSDLTARATRFAEFNAWLNETPAVRCVEAAGYEGVVGQTFDLISAHPPYVPSIGDGAVFRDGGSLGENVLRDVIQGVPNHLKAGGGALIMGQGRSTHDETWPERVRSWLGKDSRSFDLVLGVFNRSSPAEIAEKVSEKREIGRESLKKNLETLFAEHGTCEFVYGVLWLKHVREEGTRVTEVVDLAEEATFEVLDSRLRWGRIKAGPGFPMSLVGSRPKLAKGLELHSMHRATDDGFVPAECFLRIQRPVVSSARVEPAMVGILNLFDGTRECGRVYEMALESGRVPTSLSQQEWLGMIEAMMDRGFLSMDWAGMESEV